ncbi:MAG: DoxX family protein [Bacteroidetes bacterium]|nr:DoxX family protein [Bacteroidota bacterium]
MNARKIIFWCARLIAAAIMLQTLYFKFSGAEESVYIFTQMGIEPWGRIGTGVMELVASSLLIIPATVWLGAILAIGLMGGAIMSHLLVLGIEVKGDGGLLFIYALLVLACSLTAFWLSRENWPAFIKKFVPGMTK